VSNLSNKSLQSFIIKILIKQKPELDYMGLVLSFNLSLNFHRKILYTFFKNARLKTRVENNAINNTMNKCLVGFLFRTKETASTPVYMVLIK